MFLGLCDCQRPMASRGTLNRLDRNLQEKCQEVRASLQRGNRIVSLRDAQKLSPSRLFVLHQVLPLYYFLKKVLALPPKWYVFNSQKSRGASHCVTMKCSTRQIWGSSEPLSLLLSPNALKDFVGQKFRVHVHLRNTPGRSE